MLQVDGDAALVEIEKRKQAAALLDDCRAMRPQLAPALTPRLLHLDDIRAHVCQQLGGIGARDEMSQIDDANVAERAISHRQRDPRSSASIIRPTSAIAR